MRNRYFITLFLLSLGGLFSCDIEERNPSEQFSFLRIYEDSRFDASYLPLDIIQTADSGYLILSARRIRTSDFSGIQVIRVDKQGFFQREQSLEEEWVHPVKSWIAGSNGYHFVGMNATNLQAHIFDVSDSGVVASPRAIGGITYPLYLSQQGNSTLLLSYNSFDKLTVLSQLNAAGNVGASRAYSIGAGDGVDKPIIEHFTRTGRQLPFFCGSNEQGPYFNGFFNYTLSLVFANLGQDNPRGVIQGQQERGGIGAVLPLGGGNFALSVFNFGDNYFNPLESLPTTGLSQATDFAKNPMAELVPDAPVRLLEHNHKGSRILLYASNTKRGEIMLAAYDAGSGALVGTKYLGFSNPFEIASIRSTLDGGLAVLGTTYSTGRFARICLFKLAEEDLDTWIKI